MHLLHSTSSGLSSMMKVHGVNVNQITAAQDMQAAEYQQQLQEQQLAELLKNDPFSTVGQPGDNNTAQIRILPPRTRIVMPEPVDPGVATKQEDCFSESWWTRTLAPAPKFETQDNRHYLPKNTMNKPAEVKDIKFPPTIANFPIRFDPLLGYKQFLS